MTTADGFIISYHYEIKRIGIPPLDLGLEREDIQMPDRQDTFP
jgi:hypothetical protein